MSFLKKLGRSKSLSKTVENPEGGEGKDEEGKDKNKSSHRRARSFNIKQRSADENEKEKDKDRRKFKDMTGILHGGAQEAVTYPTFSVHYLGRIPTSTEYGREAVEDPVNQLCKLREKQKLQRVFLIFNVEGLYCREVSGPFLKHKKDGFNLHIPLHHITYGVGCAAHPTVFACIAKMNDDPSPDNQVLVLHAFLCDKPETTQAITYWQLQAYIEAYEDLKRKRILRARRKQAMEGSVTHPKQTGMTEVPEEGSSQVDYHKGKHQPNNNNQPEMTVVTNPAPSIKAHKATKEDSSTTHPLPQQPGQAPKPGPKPQQHLPSQQLQQVNHSAPQSAPRSLQIIADLHPGEFASGHIPPVGRKPIPGALDEQDNPRINAFQNQRHMDSPRPGPGGRIRKNRASITSTGSTASYTTTASSSSSSSGRGSPSTPSPGPEKSNKTFEKRIGELNNLVTMDAEKLKSLMINEHPTLARRIYYRATVDESGVFLQGDGDPVDDGSADSQA